MRSGCKRSEGVEELGVGSTGAVTGCGGRRAAPSRRDQGEGGGWCAGKVCGEGVGV